MVYRKPVTAVSLNHELSEIVKRKAAEEQVSIRAIVLRLLRLGLSFETEPK